MVRHPVPYHLRWVFPGEGKSTHHTATQRPETRVRERVGEGRREAAMPDDQDTLINNPFSSLPDSTLIIFLSSFFLLLPLPLLHLLLSLISSFLPCSSITFSPSLHLLSLALPPSSAFPPTSLPPSVSLSYHLPPFKDMKSILSPYRSDLKTYGTKKREYR